MSNPLLSRRKPPFLEKPESKRQVALQAAQNKEKLDYNQKQFLCLKFILI